ncbi:acyltransferase family protein [Rhodoplanes roseus]|uniref:Acyltransferase 3 domain-containing protein n=1 Tax=Rhodoplanes roseus TaxID=29409 RepID=A0A327L5H6_9BRAD|nr:acyltransferase [Rhodoplanes roseus]RAI45454.1 hypothetical protein CH341_03850 [Rhodoplanes roseus]
MATRNESMDGLRGFAAAAVVLFHTILSTDEHLIARVLGPSFWHVPVAELPTKLALSIFNGETAVAIFFVLSGAVLLGSLERQPGAAGFVVRRVFRIYPALLAAILSGALVLALQGRAPGPAELGANLVLGDFSIIGAAWTLNAEFVAIPFILLSAWALRLIGPAGLVVAFGAAFLIVKIPGAQAVVLYVKPYLLCFALGFAVATPTGAWLGRRLSGGWCVGALTTMLVLRHAIPSANLSTLLLQVSAGLLVCALWHDRAGRLGAVLSRPASVFLGRISYSLYLFNVPLLIAFGPLIAGRDPVLIGVPTGIAVLGLTIPLAVLAERWIERPGIRAGSAVAARLATARPARVGSLSRAPADLRAPS